MWSNILIACLVMLLISVLIATLLIIGEHYFAVKLEDDVDKIKSMLPGINCGACGFVNCEGFAKALKNKKVNDASACKVMSSEQINIVNEFIKKGKS